MASLEQLQAQRARILQEIERRGGRAKAPGFVQQLSQIDTQINQTRGGGGGSGGSPASPVEGGNGEASTDMGAPSTSRLNRADRRRFERIRRSQGPDSANAFRRNIQNPSSPGSTNIPYFDPQDPQNIIEGSDKMIERGMERGARYNRPDEFSPYGSSRYIQNPDGSWERKTELSPDEQEKLDREGDVTIGIGDYMKRQIGSLEQGDLNFDDLPGAPTADEAGRQSYEDKMYAAAKRRLDEQFGEDESRMRRNLLNEGKVEGSEAYNREIERFNEDKASAYLDAQDRAFAGAGSEQSRMYGLGERTRDRAVNERLTKRRSPIEELVGVSGLRSGVNNPNFTPFQAIDAPQIDIPGLALGHGQMREQGRQFDRSFGLERDKFNWTKDQAGGGSGGGGGGGGRRSSGGLSQGDIDAAWIDGELGNFQPKKKKSSKGGWGQTIMGAAGAGASGAGSAIGEAFYN